MISQPWIPILGLLLASAPAFAVSDLSGCEVTNQNVKGTLCDDPELIQAAEECLNLAHSHSSSYLGPEAVNITNCTRQSWGPTLGRGNLYFKYDCNYAYGGANTFPNQRSYQTYYFFCPNPTGN